MKAHIFPKLLTSFLFIFTSAIAAEASSGNSANDPLPSWNEGPIKTKILSFVHETTDPQSPHYVIPRERIAAIDMDGTITCEHPINFQRAIALQRLRELAEAKPELKSIQPYKAACEFDDAYQANSDNHNFIFLTAFKDYTLHDFYEYAKNYAHKEVQAPFNRKFTELHYQPGAELVKYLRDNNFRVYICSTTEENCIRVLLENCMDLEHCNIIGNEVDLTFVLAEDNKHHFRMHDTFRQPENRKENKCVYLHNQIGEYANAPIFAFGNSMGDYALLAFAEASKHKKLIMVLDHDDANRELEYHCDDLLTLAKKHEWAIISMKNDFKQVFPSK